MLAVERKCSRVRGADAQLGDLNSVSTHKIHGVVLKIAANARASHLLNQVKEVHVPTSWLLKDLHLHLSNDLVAVPGVNIPVWELGNAQSKPLDVVHAIGSIFVEKAIPAEATNVRVTPERDTYRRMRVEIDRLEYESLGLHNLVRLTVGVMSRRGVAYCPCRPGGRDSAIFTESTSSCANCLTARSACARFVSLPLLFYG
jgi:hypothetical protein